MLVILQLYLDTNQLCRAVVMHSDPALVRWFLTKETKPNLEQALEIAASQASTEIVDILIENGAQVKDSMAMHHALHRSD